MSNDKPNPEHETPRAIAGAGGVAPDYAAMMADDLQTRAGGVAPNYAVAVEVTPPGNPVEGIEPPGATDPK
jgi:hypothetical protein